MSTDMWTEFARFTALPADAEAAGSLFRQLSRTPTRVRARAFGSWLVRGVNQELRGADADAWLRGKVTAVPLVGARIVIEFEPINPELDVPALDAARKRADDGTADTQFLFLNEPGGDDGVGA